MPTYRVRPGHRHGVGRRHGPGDVVELTETEAAGFLDKLVLVEEKPGVPEPEPKETSETVIDLSIYPNVDAVMDAVESGELDAAATLETERAGDARVTLIRQLEAILDGES